MFIIAQAADVKSANANLTGRRDVPNPKEFGAILEAEVPDATPEVEADPAPATPEKAEAGEDADDQAPVIATPVPVQAANLIPPTAVTNPVVLAAAAAVEATSSTAPAAVGAISNASGATETTPAKLPKAPDDIRLDVAVVEVPPVEEPGVAAVEVPGEPFTEEDPLLEELPEEPSVKPEEPADTAEPLPTGQNQVDSRPIRAGSHVNTPEGPQLRLDTHNMVRELADRLQMMAAARQKEGVVVQLEPPNLGQITLLVKPEGNAVTAEISATHDQVRQALIDSQPQLQRRLELRGVVVADVSVSAETSNHNPQKRSGDHSPDRPISPSSFASEGSKGVSAASAPVVKRIRRAKGLDLWI